MVSSVFVRGKNARMLSGNSPATELYWRETHLVLAFRLFCCGQLQDATLLLRRDDLCNGKDER